MTHVSPLFLERNEIHLLAIVIDATPAKKFAGRSVDLPGGVSVPMLNRVFDALIAFGNAHLMQSIHNQLAVIACNSHTT